MTRWVDFNFEGNTLVTNAKRSVIVYLMKIQMLRTVRLTGMYPIKTWTFFKGRKYAASIAINQPDHEKLGKVFAQKSGVGCILLERGDYRVV